MNTRRQSWRFVAPVLLIVIILVIGAVLYLRPLPTIKPSMANLPPPASAATFPAVSWPASGEAAVGAVSFGVLATHGDQTSLPTASVAKVITALAVLNKYPLGVGDNGPTITLTDADVASYNQYAAEDGSVAPVQSGEQLTEYQALETMLLPSANNMADSLARWAYGSLPAYSTQANLLLRTWGMNHTTVGVDASGFDPSTISTAGDLVMLGAQAMQNPVLAQIVSQSQATVPVAGTIRNTNVLLGNSGIVGIKTGNNDQDTGVFIGATKQTVDGQLVTIISAVMGMPDLQTALTSSVPLLNSAKANFAVTTLAKAGTAVGSYSIPWASAVPAVTQSDINLLTWQGTTEQPVLNLKSITAPHNTSTPVGTLAYSAGQNTESSPIVLKGSVPKPAFWWRIFHH